MEIHVIDDNPGKIHWVDKLQYEHTFSVGSMNIHNLYRHGIRKQTVWSTI